MLGSLLEAYFRKTSPWIGPFFIEQLMEKSIFSSLDYSVVSCFEAWKFALVERKDAAYMNKKKIIN